MKGTSEKVKTTSIIKKSFFSKFKTNMIFIKACEKKVKVTIGNVNWNL